MQLPLPLICDLDNGDAKASENLDIEPRVALDIGDLADDEHRHLDAALLQGAGDHEPIAAVTALAADDRDLALGEILKKRFHRRHHLAAGVFHEDEEGMPRSSIVRRSASRICSAVRILIE